jgi:hypothetical protein
LIIFRFSPATFYFLQPLQEQFLQSQSAQVLPQPQSQSGKNMLISSRKNHKWRHGIQQNDAEDIDAQKNIIKL